ncbi:MAG: glycoside hydrolase family 5 protein [Lachnospiraceae bacterium]|nr:glycoside hydrolase family 5 protein [Lachnospiraceae bacterium]
MKIFEGFQQGVNLGGWISQYDRYDEQHFDTYITEADIKKIADLGFDHVRVPVDYPVLETEDGQLKETGFRYLEACRSWCEAHGMRMLIDLHECFGYSFDPLKKDMDRKKFFYDEELQARFFKLWEEIARRFADHADQVAFEPLNEVVLYEVADAWNKLAASYIERMRKIVPDSYIVLGGVCYNSVTTVPLLNVPIDDKLVYNFHCYEPFIFTHQGAYWVNAMPKDWRIGYPKTLEEYREAGRKLDENLAGAVYTEGIREIGEGFFEDLFAPAIEKATKDDVPLYCGEYGAIDLADDEDRLRWLHDIHGVFRKHGIGHALWNYKGKDFEMKDLSLAMK